MAGKRAVKILCRISLEPESCVRRTEDALAKYGMPGLIAAKFVPGLSTLLPPLAGGSGVGLSRFLFFDAISSVLYCGSFMLLGFVFSDQLDQVLASIAGLGNTTLTVSLLLLAAFVAYKFWRRRRVLHELRGARISVDDLRRQQQTGGNPLVVDLRASTELEEDPYLIPGAIHIDIHSIEERWHEIPRDRDVILYCSCPNDIGSARAAMLLQRNGLTRVRPLLGGIDAWRERNYPVESWDLTADTIKLTRGQTSLQELGKYSGESLEVASH